MSYTIEELKQLRFRNGLSSSRWFMQGHKQMINAELSTHEYVTYKGTFIIQKFDKWGNPTK